MPSYKGDPQWVTIRYKDTQSVDLLPDRGARSRDIAQPPARNP